MVKMETQVRRVTRFQETIELHSKQNGKIKLQNP